MSRSINNLSQNTLEVWQTCRRKFRYQFIDELRFPAPIEQQQKLEKGRQFHLTIQQRRLGVDTKAPDDYQLQLWLDNYYRYPPTLIAGKEYLEIYRSWQMEGVNLVGVYDLLIIGKNQAQIVDWKTHQTPIKPQFLREDWQTKLYLYLLKNISNLPAQNLTMIYWFANDPQNPVTINYSQPWHDRIHQELLTLVQEINHESAYPTLLPDSESCQRCEFTYRCFGNNQLNDLNRSSSDGASVDNFSEVVI